MIRDFMGFPARHGGIQKWLVFNGKSQSKINDLEVPLFQETIIWPLKMMDHAIDNLRVVLFC